MIITVVPTIDKALIVVDFDRRTLEPLRISRPMRLLEI